MTFIVFDQGGRIETPWYDIFPPKTLQATEASTASRAIGQEDENKEGAAQSGVHPDLTKHYQNLPDKAERSPITLASQIMSEPAIYISESLTLMDAWRAFAKHKFRHFAVTNTQQKLVGIVSDRDILLATSMLEGNSIQDPLRTQVKSVMNQRVLGAQSTTSIRHLAKAIHKHRVGALPIVNEHNQIIGMVTRSDILKALINEAPVELWA